MLAINRQFREIYDQAPRAEPVRLPRPGRPWTAEDLLALAGDEAHYELVHGDLFMMAPASPVQGRYASRLIGALEPHVEENELREVYTAESGFVLVPGPEPTIRAPDVAFVARDRIPAEEDQAGFWIVAPDLAVEIISPSESAQEIQAKVQDYLDAGTQLLWLVYPKTQTVVVYHASGIIQQLSGDDRLEGGDVIPGFSLSLRRLFRE